MIAMAGSRFRSWVWKNKGKKLTKTQALEEEAVVPCPWRGWQGWFCDCWKNFKADAAAAKGMKWHWHCQMSRVAGGSKIAGARGEKEQISPSSSYSLVISYLWKPLLLEANRDPAPKQRLFSEVLAPASHSDVDGWIWNRETKA